MAKLKVTLSSSTNVVDAKNKKGQKDVRKQEFDVDHANRLLAIPNTRWKLADDKWKWNGKELAKKTA